MEIDIHQGDALAVLRTLPENSVHCCVTSPPYWNYRNYGVAGQIGMEPSMEEYIQNLVAVFNEVKRVLRNDGTCWIVIGDSYAGGGRGSMTPKQQTNRGSRTQPASIIPQGLKAKDLCGIPWRLAFALQAEGWYWRSEIIWHKTNSMTENVTDRPPSNESSPPLKRRAKNEHNLWERRLRLPC